jgi:hypothetical protein
VVLLVQNTKASMGIHQFKSSVVRGGRKDYGCSAPAAASEDYWPVVVILAGGVAAMIWAVVMGSVGLRLVL